MWRLPWLAIFAMAVVAQTPAAHQVSLTVVDVDGKPIADARIDHVGGIVVNGPPSVPIENGTDANGRRVVHTTSRAIVIRKPGYVSYRLVIEHDIETRVTLKPLPRLRCEPARIPGVKTEESRDADYVQIRRYVETPKGTKGFSKGSGPTYSFGAPPEKFVQDSVQYSEIMHPDGLIDARGKMPDGTYWREQTLFGEATHYWDVDEETAHLLDRLIDGDCHPQE